MKRIVVLDGQTENPGDLSWAGLGGLGELTVYERTPPELTGQRIGPAEIVFTNKTLLSREIIAAAPNLEYIGVLATGFDVVDSVAARERGVPVTNVPSYGTAAVAQFAIALLLEVCHHIGHHDQAVHAGRWAQGPDFCFWDYPLIELAGQPLGIVGYGRIGRATGRIAQALGLEVIAYEVSGPVGEAGDGTTLVGLDELWSRSDVVVLHCPLTPLTEGLINAATIARMKDGAILINNSRGQLVVEADLAAALDSGKLAAAAVDVVSTEPIRSDNPLLTAKNCLITPHISWASRQARQRLMDVAVDNLRQFLAGRPVNVVN
ncbi:MAG: D-2-hydroxyacid dehydrogenase [Propionibacteriaceae bacterium]|nr:D-2-hydroxyacid dehydrogenase [Propionibacteriaceae bacterium]